MRSLIHRLPKLTLTLAAVATLSGCCDPGGTPVPVGGSIAGESVMRTRDIPNEDSVNVPPVPEPLTSGPHQTNIVITTKRGKDAPAVQKRDVTATVSKDKHTLTITVKTPGAFEPK